MSMTRADIAHDSVHYFLDKAGVDEGTQNQLCESLNLLVDIANGDESNEREPNVNKLDIAMCLVDDLFGCEDDADIWKLLLDNKEHMQIQLDNDSTHIEVIICDSIQEDFDDMNDGCWWMEFDNSIGNMPGIDDMLTALNIKFERV